MSALVDTGSDVTIGSTKLAKKFKWQIRRADISVVTAANNEPIHIDAEVNEIISIAGQKISTRIYLTNDLTELVLGYDWLKSQDCVWDFVNNRLQIKGGARISLYSSRGNECRRPLLQRKFPDPT